MSWSVYMYVVCACWLIYLFCFCVISGSGVKNNPVFRFRSVLTNGRVTWILWFVAGVCHFGLDTTDIINIYQRSGDVNKNEPLHFGHFRNFNRRKTRFKCFCFGTELISGLLRFYDGVQVDEAPAIITVSLISMLVLYFIACVILVILDELLQLPILSRIINKKALLNYVITSLQCDGRIRLMLPQEKCTVGSISDCNILCTRPHQKWS
jgi:hypothetical protein